MPTVHFIYATTADFFASIVSPAKNVRVKVRGSGGEIRNKLD